MIDRFGAEHRKRLAVVLIAFFVILVLASSETVHAMIEGMLEFSEQWIHRHPGSGMVVFVIFSMFSAMLAFVSSALLVPIAIHAWGEVWTVLLLWTGWLLGGATAYGFGRYLGRPVMSWFVSVERLRAYEGRISRRAGFPVVLLFQLALPSEIPGYLLGTLGYRFAVYFAALALGELPYAIGAVWLARSFVERNLVGLVAIGASGILLMTGAVALWQRRQRRRNAE